MKKALFTLLSFVLLLSSTFLFETQAVASSANPNSQVNTLWETIPDGAYLAATEAASRIFDSSVRAMIRGNDEIVESRYAYEEYEQARLSAAIPVFATSVPYQKNEQYKSRLPLSSWMFVVYLGDDALAVFFIDDNNYSKEFRYNNLMGQGVARSCDNAMRKLGTTDVICLPVNGCFFLANRDDYVAMVNSPVDATDYPLVTFEKLNDATNRTINENADEKHPGGGGLGEFLDKLYGDSESDSAIRGLDLPTVLIVTTLCMGVLIAILYVVETAKKRQKVKT